MVEVVDLSGKPDDFDKLVNLHNYHWEVDSWVDRALNRLLFDHPLFLQAMEGIGHGVVSEIGPSVGTTLEQMARIYSQQLPHTLFVGVDNEEFGTPSKRYEPITAEELLHRAIGMKVFKEEFIKSARVRRHRSQQNAYYITGTAEQVFVRNAEIDLIFLKCMLGYFGSTPSESLEYFMHTLVPKSQRLFIVDYIGRKSYGHVEIPSPEDVAQGIHANKPGMNIRVNKGQHHFVLYAGK